METTIVENSNRRKDDLAIEAVGEKEEPPKRLRESALEKTCRFISDKVKTAVQEKGIAKV